ncbi:MAG: amidohydrolase family protein [Kiritimatiellaeota bacterium]|nr:amidohydrolase family protein [Kiritimatiellota bacterium]
MADSLNAFDIRCTVGRRLHWRPGEPETAADLIEAMDRHGIAEAMVLDCLGRECHPADGNARVAQTTAARPRLHSMWTALPHGEPDEQPAPEVFLEAMRRHKVGAVCLFPRQYRFSLADWCVDAFLEPLAAACVPVIIDPVEIGPRIEPGMDATDWDGVVALCRRWPHLPVVISEQRIRRSQRTMYRALDACENLHIEIGACWLYRFIEYAVRTWGPHRFVFGSNWPYAGMHRTLATLAFAEVSDKDKRAIAGNNWRRLIAWCGPEHPEWSAPPPSDEYVQLGRTGQRSERVVVHDCHGHIGQHLSHYHIPDSSLDAVVREMERIGVRHACVFGFSGVVSDERPDNDAVAEAVRDHSELFTGFVLLNPHRGEGEMLRELERGAARGLRGIKLIPSYQGYPVDGPGIEAACRWAHERRWIILNHHWGPCARLERLIDRYPDACYITGHMTLEYAELMKRVDNLFVCTCPLLGPRACEEAVSVLGAERLLFGSDLEDLPIAWGLGPILFADIPPSDKTAILGGNLRRLLARWSAAAGGVSDRPTPVRTDRDRG